MEAIKTVNLSRSYNHTTVLHNLNLTVQKGEVYGCLMVKLDDTLLERCDLIGAASVEQAGLFSRLWDQLVLFVRGILGLAS